DPATRLRLPPLRERRADRPAVVRFAFLEALRAEALQPLVRAYLARFPTPDPFDDARNEVVFGRPRAAVARRDAFTVFISREALARLSDSEWPGNQRELKLLAANAVVFGLTQHLDGQVVAQAARAPAVLDVPDPLIARLLGGELRRSPRARSSNAGRAGGRRIEVEVAAQASFARVSADVERQYLRALYEACGGDLGRMARELLGPGGTARQVHLRMNQLGLRVRDLRGAAP
ncbi:MAG: hypothetical protein ABUS79_31905, partial [Pseudomonadota bacterium]